MMDEEFSQSSTNLIQVPSQAGALMRPKEMRSGVTLMNAKGKGWQAADAEWAVNGLVELQ